MKKAFVSLLLLLSLFNPTAARASDYQLPYPGMLPDNPLYSLKLARDNFLLWLSSGTTDKTAMYLFLSDKRLATAQALVARHKIKLAETTLISSEDYYAKATSEFKKVPGKDRLGLLLKFISAGRVREELLPSLTSGMSGPVKQKSEQSLLNLEIFKKSIVSELLQVKAPH